MNPTQIGLMFLLAAGCYAITAPLVGWIGDKTVRCAFKDCAVYIQSLFGIVVSHTVLDHSIDALVRFDQTQ